MCSLIAHVDNGKVVRIQGDPDQPYTAGFACGKVNRDSDLVNSPERIATPLLMVVVLVGITDVIFAVDSIPAIFAITDDPFIVLTSNIFAILGLRAMFFLLAAMAAKFHLLSYGLAVILVFIGTKMLLIDLYKIPVGVSLGVVVAILAVTMVWSVKTAPRIPAPAGER